MAFLRVLLFAIVFDDLGESEHVAVTVEGEVVVTGGEIVFSREHLRGGFRPLRLEIEALVAQDGGPDNEQGDDASPDIFTVFFEELVDSRHSLFYFFLLELFLLRKNFFCHNVILFIFLSFRSAMRNSLQI